MTQHFQKTVDIKAVDAEARTATGAVLVPDELDHQFDFLRPDAVERFHNDDVKTGVMHSAFPDDAATLTRSAVIDAPETIGDEEFPAGTWVAERKYEDDDLWQLVEDGVLQGFSIGGDIDRAADHDTVPDDVRVPDDVEHDGGEVTELISGTVDEVSDVDIPAVPRATYKGADLSKSLLDDVDNEAEFVELMGERGHSESDARQLYDYLTDVRTREAMKADVSKPFESPQGARFEDFDDCVETLMEDDMERAEAEVVCGAWQEESKNKVDVDGTEVDLTPPAAVVNAAEAGLQAKREEYADELGDCGSGVGEDRAESIIANDLSVEDFVGGENTAIPDYLDSHSEDVEGIDQPPTDWGAETWTDGCGPVQYSLWGGTATGTGLEWANETEQQVREAMNKNLDDPEFSEGDAVQWSSNDVVVRGRVADIGDEFSPAEGVTITGDEGEAVYLIHELDDSLEPPRYRRENVAKPQSSLDESAADLPPASEDNFEDNMTTENTADGIDDATKLQVIKSWLTGSDDSETSGEAPDAGALKADDGDEMDDEDDEDEEDEEEKAASGTTENMAKESTEEPPAWAEDLTEKVEQIEKRVDEVEGDAEDTEKSAADAPQWARDLMEKVDDLDERVDTISKQSGHSQQLDATEKDADDTADETEKFKAGLVGGR
jgi:hypothetical protein